MHTVAIVGRPNVGKSSIFNRLAGRRISIVHDQPGVTRDRISAVCEQGALPFEIVDTGGIGATLNDGFAEQVQAEAEIALETANWILFVVDAQEGLTPIDEELADRLRRRNVPTLLVANKVDVDKHVDLVGEFSALGLGDPFPLSAEHGRNFPELLRFLGNRMRSLGLDPDSSEEESGAEPNRIRLAIVGRPNVGKSSLVNAVLEDERSIVSDVAGTTRDAVDIPYERGGRHYTLIDTAGMRRRTKRDSSVEVFSAMRSERSIRRSDLCLLVVDASRGVTAMDRTIAQQILEAHKPCVIVVNKFDLFHPQGVMKDRLEELRETFGRELFFLHYAPFVAVSAKKAENLNRIFGGVERVIRAASAGMSTGVLNRFLRLCVERNPPPVRKNRKLNLLYATVKKADRPRPIEAPRLLLFVNHADLLTRTYQRHLENELREEFDLTGLPIQFLVRSRQNKLDGG